MSRLIILNGTLANDGTGDNLRVTADKINSNFSELYGLLHVQPNGDIYIYNSNDRTTVVKIGDPDCNNITVPGCDSPDPITIGDPIFPGIVVPPNTEDPIVIGPKNPVVIGDPEHPTIFVPKPGTTDPVKIGDTDSPVQIGNPTNPSIVTPSPTAPVTTPIQIGNGTNPVKIGDPAGPNITVPKSGGTDPIQIINPTGPITIGDPTDPSITIPKDGPVTIGNTNQPAELYTGKTKWEILYTGDDGKLDSSEYLRVTPDNEDSEGKSVHLGISTYDLGFGNSLKQNAVYFRDDSIEGEEAEAWPSKRVASIRYSGSAFGAGLFFSPWYNYNDTAFPGRGVGIWRQTDDQIPNTKVTLNGEAEGAGRHGVDIGRGAISFFQDLPSWDVAEDNTESEAGLSYIILPAIHTGNNGQAYIGQISANPYKIRREILSTDPEYIGGTMTMGIPYFSLGSKRTNQLIENEPPEGFEKYERTPGDECIIWDVNCRVELGDVGNGRGIKIPGTEDPGAPIEIGGGDGGGLKIPTDGSGGPTLGNPGTGEPPAGGGGSGGPNGGTPAQGNAGGTPGVSVPAPWNGDNGANPENPLKLKNPDGPIEIGNPDTGPGIRIPTPGSEDPAQIVTGLTPNRVVWTKPELGELGVSENFKFDDTTLEINADVQLDKLDASRFVKTDVDNKLISADVDWTDIQNIPDSDITVDLAGNLTGTGTGTMTDLGDVTVTVTGSYIDTLFVPEYVSTFTPDREDGSVQTVTLTGDITLNEPVNLAVGGTMTVIFKQDGTGSRLISYEADTFIFASGIKTLTTTPNAVDMLNIFNTGSGYMAALTTDYKA
jgi:hypothetical protein